MPLLDHFHPPLLGQRQGIVPCSLGWSDRRYVQAGVGVVVVDNVTDRLANLHDAIIDLMELPETRHFPEEELLDACSLPCRPVART